MNISIKKTARIGGMLYLAIIAAGIFSEMFVRNKLIVAEDAVATANNIIASQLLWRIGITTGLLMHLLDVPLMLIIYILLKPVNKNVALLAMLFTLIQTAVLVATKLNLFTPLFLLGNDDYMKAFDLHQLQALSYVSIRLDGYGFGVGLLFFGFQCIVAGYLIFKSGYFPKAIGVLMAIAGISYLVNSFTLILAPAYASKIFPVMVLAFIGELSFCLWLLVKGVNVNKWEEKQKFAA